MILRSKPPPGVYPTSSFMPSLAIWSAGLTDSHCLYQRTRNLLLWPASTHPQQFTGHRHCTTSLSTWMNPRDLRRHTLSSILRLHLHELFTAMMIATTRNIRAMTTTTLTIRTRGLVETRLPPSSAHPRKSSNIVQRISNLSLPYRALADFQLDSSHAGNMPKDRLERC